MRGSNGSGSKGPRPELRGDIITALARGDISVQQAAAKLGRSVRQVYRIRAKARQHGGAELRHGNIGRTPANKISAEVWERVVSLVRTKYTGVPYYELQDILRRHHNISIGRESLRKRLQAAGIPSKRDTRY
ncbi:MAG TPA: helix-turn-helix domain-containing protein [Blastocatellia bacterium]|nr:helix-turn-helix domain-containing protein [Blastocatellia bacterium]